MKNLKLGLFSLLAILAVSVFLTSCEQEAVPTPELPDPVHKQMEVVSSEVLSEDDIRLAELKTIVESEVVEKGTFHFNAVTFVEYSDPNATALILPVITKGETRVSWLISYFTNGEYKNSMFIEFTPTEEYVQKVVENRDVDYSGEFAVYTKSGEVVAKNVISEGTVIETYENTELRGCFKDCILWNIEKNVSWYARWACKSSFYTCAISLGVTGVLVSGIITAPSAVPSAIAASASCGFLIGCIGGSFHYCIDKC